MKLIYIAGPYRGRFAWDVEQNIRRAEELALDVWRRTRCAAVCVHSMNRYFEGMIRDEDVLEGTMELMRRCDAVLMAQGWEASQGATAERLEAIRLGIPVFEEMGGLIVWARKKP
jgi:hypothetical protein